MTCPDCTSNGGTYNLRCLPCAARYLRNVCRADRNKVADTLCRLFGHDRAALLAEYKRHRNGPADGR